MSSPASDRPSRRGSDSDDEERRSSPSRRRPGGGHRVAGHAVDSHAAVNQAAVNHAAVNHAMVSSAAVSHAADVLRRMAGGPPVAARVVDRLRVRLVPARLGTTGETSAEGLGPAAVAGRARRRRRARACAPRTHGRSRRRPSARRRRIAHLPRRRAMQRCGSTRALSAVRPASAARRGVRDVR